jgi:hypothetical protein
VTSSAYVTAAEDLVLRYWNGVHPLDTEEVRVLKGSTLRVTMVSRFGDCGLSEKLDQHVYGIRLCWDDNAISDIRLTENPTVIELTDFVKSPTDRM